MLVLRPEPGASITARAAEAMGLVAHVRPLFEIAALDWTPPDPAHFDAVMLTSANAATAISHYRWLPIFAVGARSAAAARAAGATDVRPGSSDASALVATIMASGATRVLHLSGKDRIAVDPGPLSLTVIPVYAARAIDPAPALDDAAAHVVLLHSPRAAAHFAALSPVRATTRIAAISAATAAAAGDGWAACTIAAEPNDSALLAAAAGLCHSSHACDDGTR